MVLWPFTSMSTSRPTTMYGPSESEYDPILNQEPQTSTTSHGHCSVVPIIMYPQGLVHHLAHSISPLHESDSARDCPISHDPIEYFKIFLSDGLITLFTRETKTHVIKQIHKRIVSGKLKLHCRINSWKNVTVKEMNKLLAIMLNMGLTQRRNMEDYLYHNPAEYIPWYSNTMSLRRFQAIQINLYLTSHRARRKDDPKYALWVKI